MQKLYCGCAFSGTGTHIAVTIAEYGIPNSGSDVLVLMALREPVAEERERSRRSFLRWGMEKERSDIESAFSSVAEDGLEKESLRFLRGG